MIFDTAMLSRKGGRERNEDACGGWRDDGSACWVLADGAGGHGGGGVASRTAVEAALASFSARPRVDPASLGSLLQASHLAVRHRQAEGGELADMRTTLVVLGIDLARECAQWAHVGDSRLYAFRDGRLQTQSRDHSVMQRMVDAGFAAADDLRDHPRRGALLHALGGSEPLPDSAIHGNPWFLREDDAFLLCSDGLWEHVRESTMESALRNSIDAASWLAALERALLAGAPRGHDNYTALAVRVVRIGDAARLG